MCTFASIKDLFYRFHQSKSNPNRHSCLNQQTCSCLLYVIGSFFLNQISINRKPCHSSKKISCRCIENILFANISFQEINSRRSPFEKHVFFHYPSFQDFNNITRVKAIREYYYSLVEVLSIKPFYGAGIILFVEVLNIKPF